MSISTWWPRQNITCGADMFYWWPQLSNSFDVDGHLITVVCTLGAELFLVWLFRWRKQQRWTLPSSPKQPAPLLGKRVSVEYGQRKTLSGASTQSLPALQPWQHHRCLHCCTRFQRLVHNRYTTTLFQHIYTYSTILPPPKKKPHHTHT